jgi:hypothetical protein
MPAESGLLLAFEGQAEVWSQEFDSTPLALAVDGEEHRIYVAAADRHLYVVKDR